MQYGPYDGSSQLFNMSPCVWLHAAVCIMPPIVYIYIYIYKFDLYKAIPCNKDWFALWEAALNVQFLRLCAPLHAGPLWVPETRLKQPSMLRAERSFTASSRHCHSASLGWQTPKQGWLILGRAWSSLPRRSQPRCTRSCSVPVSFLWNNNNPFRNNP